MKAKMARAVPPSDRMQEKMRKPRGHLVVWSLACGGSNSSAGKGLGNRTQWKSRRLQLSHRKMPQPLSGHLVSRSRRLRLSHGKKLQTSPRPRSTAPLYAHPAPHSRPQASPVMGPHRFLSLRKSHQSPLYFATLLGSVSQGRRLGVAPQPALVRACGYRCLG